jgi:hypothetical protein
MGELVILSRQLFERSYELRIGTWNKQSKGCWELRGKTLGIVGVTILLLPWLLRTSIEFATSVLQRIPEMVR